MSNISTIALKGIILNAQLALILAQIKCRFNAYFSWVWGQQQKNDNVTLSFFVSNFFEYSTFVVVNLYLVDMTMFSALQTFLISMFSALKAFFISMFSELFISVKFIFSIICGSVIFSGN